MIQMPVINPENNDPTVSVQEKATFPEWHVKKWCMTTILRVNHNFLKYETAREEVIDSMKDHQEYNVWVQNFAPSILAMVLEQLNVYKTVGEGRGSDSSSRCTITTKWRSSCSPS